METPTFASVSTASTSYNPSLAFMAATPDAHQLVTTESLRRIQNQAQAPKAAAGINNPINQLKEIKVSFRIVKVYLVDKDSRIPVEKRILYEGPEQKTELEDQELFFEMNVKELLDAHNAYRTKVPDKKATEKIGKEVLLEAVRIKDLTMTVVNIASF